jgi:phytoene dehydrogenase-like protein
VAEGGSQAVADALAACLAEHGGRIETGTPIDSYEQVRRADIVMLDVAPAAAVAILGDRLPRRVARAYGRYRRGAGVVKLDLAVAGGVPWTHPGCRRAGTLHLGGDLTEIVATERAVAAGRLPERPFVLVGQQYLADPGRSVGDVHPIWAYAHVPAGYPGDGADVAEAIVAQLERFAPGVRERIRARAVRSTSDLAAYNRNYAGGDIATGANDPRQVVLRPRAALDPYRTGVDGVYLCSAATPPGAGVHGMCGYHAARSALRGR